MTTNNRPTGLIAAILPLSLLLAAIGATPAQAIPSPEPLCYTDYTDFIVLEPCPEICGFNTPLMTCVEPACDGDIQNNCVPAICEGSLDNCVPVVCEGGNSNCLAPICDLQTDCIPAICDEELNNCVPILCEGPLTECLPPIPGDNLVETVQQVIDFVESGGGGGQTVSVCHSTMQVCSLAGAGAARDRVAGVPGHPLVLWTQGHGQSNNQLYGANVVVETSLGGDSFDVAPMAGEGRLYGDIRAPDSACVPMYSRVTTTLLTPGPVPPSVLELGGLIVAVAAADDAICETI